MVITIRTFFFMLGEKNGQDTGTSSTSMLSSPAFDASWPISHRIIKAVYIWGLLYPQMHLHDDKEDELADSPGKT